MDPEFARTLLRPMTPEHARNAGVYREAAHVSPLSPGSTPAAPLSRGGQGGEGRDTFGGRSDAGSRGGSRHTGSHEANFGERGRRSGRSRDGLAGPRTQDGDGGTRYGQAAPYDPTLASTAGRMPEHAHGAGVGREAAHVPPLTPGPTPAVPLSRGGQGNEGCGVSGGRPDAGPRGGGRRAGLHEVDLGERGRRGGRGQDGLAGQHTRESDGGTQCRQVAPCDPMPASTADLAGGGKAGDGQSSHGARWELLNAALDEARSRLVEEGRTAPPGQRELFENYLKTYGLTFPFPYAASLVRTLGPHLGGLLRTIEMAVSKITKSGNRNTAARKRKRQVLTLMACVAVAAEIGDKALHRLETLDTIAWRDSLRDVLAPQPQFEYASRCSAGSGGDNTGERVTGGGRRRAVRRALRSLVRSMGDSATLGPDAYRAYRKCKDALQVREYFAATVGSVGRFGSDASAYPPSHNVGLQTALAAASRKGEFLRPEGARASAFRTFMLAELAAAAVNETLASGMCDDILGHGTCTLALRKAVDEAVHGVHTGASRAARVLFQRDLRVMGHPDGWLPVASPVGMASALGREIGGLPECTSLRTVTVTSEDVCDVCMFDAYPRHVRTDVLRLHPEPDRFGHPAGPKPDLGAALMTLTEPGCGPEPKDCGHGPCGARGASWTHTRYHVPEMLVVSNTQLEDGAVDWTWDVDFTIGGRPLLLVAVIYQHGPRHEGRYTAVARCGSQSWVLCDAEGTLTACGRPTGTEGSVHAWYLAHCSRGSGEEWLDFPAPAALPAMVCRTGPPGPPAARTRKRKRPRSTWGPVAGGATTKATTSPPDVRPDRALGPAHPGVPQSEPGDGLERKRSRSTWDSVAGGTKTEVTLPERWRKHVGRDLLVKPTYLKTRGAKNTDLLTCDDAKSEIRLGQVRSAFVRSWEGGVGLAYLLGNGRALIPFRSEGCIVPNPALNPYSTTASGAARGQVLDLGSKLFSPCFCILTVAADSAGLAVAEDVKFYSNRMVDSPLAAAAAATHWTTRDTSPTGGGVPARFGAHGGGDGAPSANTSHYRSHGTRPTRDGQDYSPAGGAAARMPSPEARPGPRRLRRTVPPRAGPAQATPCGAATSSDMPVHPARRREERGKMGGRRSPPAEATSPLGSRPGGAPEPARPDDPESEPEDDLDAPDSPTRLECILGVACKGATCAACGGSSIVPHGQPAPDATLGVVGHAAPEGGGLGGAPMPASSSAATPRARMARSEADPVWHGWAKPLSKKASKRVKALLQGRRPATARGILGEAMTLSPEEMAALVDPEKWVTDNVAHMYLGLVTGSMAATGITDTLVMSAFATVDRSHDPRYFSGKSTYRRMARAMRAQCGHCDLRRLNAIVWHINTAQSHWSVLYFDLAEHGLFYFDTKDSVARPGGIRNAIVTLWEAATYAAGTVSDDWTVDIGRFDFGGTQCWRYMCIRQLDDSSCGVLSCVIVAILAMGYEVPTNAAALTGTTYKDLVRTLRMRMLHEMCRPRCSFGGQSPRAPIRRSTIHKPWTPVSDAGSGHTTRNPEGRGADWPLSDGPDVVDLTTEAQGSDRVRGAGAGGAENTAGSAPSRSVGGAPSGPPPDSRGPLLKRARLVGPGRPLAAVATARPGFQTRPPEVPERSERMGCPPPRPAQARRRPPSGQKGVQPSAATPSTDAAVLPGRHRGPHPGPLLTSRRVCPNCRPGSGFRRPGGRPLHLSRLGVDHASPLLSQLAPVSLPRRPGLPLRWQASPPRWKLCSVHLCVPTQVSRPR